jgi:hypothetical protein
LEEFMGIVLLGGQLPVFSSQNKDPSGLRAPFKVIGPTLFKEIQKAHRDGNLGKANYP